MGEQRNERRLLAIMAADVVGYSRSGESRLGSYRPGGIKSDRILTTNAARETKSSRNVHPLSARISKRDCPVLSVDSER